MRLAPQITTIMCLAALLTWFSYRAIDPEAERFDQALAELDRFGTIENALYRDVFAARAGMLRNYDPLVKEVNRLRASLHRFRDTAAIDAETTATLESSVERQEELVELFKSENALLQNSLSFFGRFGANAASPELDPAISAAAAAILNLMLDTSSIAVRNVEDRLSEVDRQAGRIGQQDSVEALLAHGQLLNKLLPSVDGILKTMQALTQKQERDALRVAIQKNQLASRTSARWFRVLLYGTSLVLVGFLANLALRLKSRANTLRRRAAFEHVLAGISTRFINSSPQNIDAEIDWALAEMATSMACDRAYFIMSPPAARLRTWHKPGMRLPPGWPERAPELAAQIGTSEDGVIHIRQIPRMPHGQNKTICLSFGLGGWVCVTNVTADGSHVALGFDMVGRPSTIISKACELALLRMALDAIVQAVERSLVEQEQKRLEARLQQMRRMERIGFITSGIAHNFNNILGGILGHAEVMGELIGSDTKLARNLDAVRLGAERARDLVDQILIFGRRREASRKPLSVGALIAETASLFRVSLPASIDLVVRQPSTAAIVSGEHAQLQQVLLNLCRNAANAIQGGGHIEVATELHERSKSQLLSHGELPPGDYVSITVTDSGAGMDSTTLGRLFEPFFTTRASGNGLGLATVREIVREHGGAVNVESTVGHGTRFEIWLPMAAEPAPPLNGAMLPTGNGETVLLVALDGEHVLRDEEILAALGYEAVGFNQACAAIEACRVDPDRFDIVIVGDCGLAARSLDLATSLHAVVPRLPIVLAARTTIEIGADKLVGAGIFDVVRWPMIAEEIAIALAYGTVAKKSRNAVAASLDLDLC